MNRLIGANIPSWDTLRLWKRDLPLKTSTFIHGDCSFGAKIAGKYWPAQNLGASHQWAHMLDPVQFFHSGTQTFSSCSFSGGGTYDWRISDIIGIPIWQFSIWFSKIIWRSAQRDPSTVSIPEAMRTCEPDGGSWIEHSLGCSAEFLDGNLNDKLLLGEPQTMCAETKKCSLASLDDKMDLKQLRLGLIILTSERSYTDHQHLCDR